MSTTPVGDVRPSQLLWTYGPGALIDLPNLSVITMGLQDWQAELCSVIVEGRLLAAVQRVVGGQVKYLRQPPVSLEDSNDPFSAEARQGVPVRPFPRWLRCIPCGLIAEYDSGLFEIKKDRYRPERTHFVHKNCAVAKRDADAVPTRFLLACRNGHLDEFPWHWFVHDGPSDCKGRLEFHERSASLQTENLWVKCMDCQKSKSMAKAFGREVKKNLPACRGRHSHLHTYDNKCNEEPRAVVLGAVNNWFPITLSVLAIPTDGDTLGQTIKDLWSDFEDVESLEELRGVLKTLKRQGGVSGIDKHSLEELWQAIQNKRAGIEPGLEVGEIDLKRPEWDVLSSSHPPSDWPHFLSTPTGVPEAYQHVIHSVALLERLREVNALIAFTRVESVEGGLEEETGPSRASLTRGQPDWIPATEVYGEGIFIRFDEEAVRRWENLSAVQVRNLMLLTGHRGWRNQRKLQQDDNYPGIRYTMLHTLAHLLIREFALECGYGSASIRERIYASDDPAKPMAGILLYTAAADSDGTLGGLVELGKPENLGRILDLALERAGTCSSDPLCSEHDPSKDRTLHAASCHACGFVPETSCEKGNRYLDRALLIPTFESRDSGFFQRDPT
jgi:Domain of unknown function (DUF1998)